MEKSTQQANLLDMGICDDYKDFAAQGLRGKLTGLIPSLQRAWGELSKVLALLDYTRSCCTVVSHHTPFIFQQEEDACLACLIACNPSVHRIAINSAALFGVYDALVNVGGVVRKTLFPLRLAIVLCKHHPHLKGDARGWLKPHHDKVLLDGRIRRLTKGQMALPDIFENVIVDWAGSQFKHCSGSSTMCPLTDFELSKRDGIVLHCFVHREPREVRLQDECAHLEQHLVYGDNSHVLVVLEPRQTLRSRCCKNCACGASSALTPSPHCGVPGHVLRWCPCAFVGVAMPVTPFPVVPGVFDGDVHPSWINKTERMSSVGRSNHPAVALLGWLQVEAQKDAKGRPRFLHFCFEEDAREIQASQLLKAQPSPCGKRKTHACFMCDTLSIYSLTQGFMTLKKHYLGRYKREPRGRLVAVLEAVIEGSTDRHYEFQGHPTGQFTRCKSGYRSTKSVSRDILEMWVLGGFDYKSMYADRATPDGFAVYAGYRLTIWAMLAEQKETRRIHARMVKDYKELQAAQHFVEDNRHKLQCTRHSKLSHVLTKDGEVGDFMRFSASVHYGADAPWRKLFISMDNLIPAESGLEIDNSLEAASVPEVEYKLIEDFMGTMLDLPVPLRDQSASYTARRALPAQVKASLPAMQPHAPTTPPSQIQEPLWEPMEEAPPRGSRNPIGVGLSNAQRKWLENMFHLVVQYIDGDGYCGYHAAASIHGMTTREIVQAMLDCVLEGCNAVVRRFPYTHLPLFLPSFFPL